jgi:hypothetical protein
MLVSMVALFMSLGGVGYAATQLPSNSVGTAQLQDGSVSYQKIQANSVGNVRLADGGVINSKIASGAVSYNDIQAGAVGTKRANLNQLQARVTGTCTAGTAVGAIDNKGATTCNTTLPSEFGTTNNTATVTGTAATVSTLTLPAGTSYLAFANPVATVTSGGTAVRVTLSCTLTAGSNTVTRSAVIPTNGTAGDTSTGSIPLQLAGPAGTSAVSCSASVPGTGTLPTVSAVAAINAIQTASNS